MSYKFNVFEFLSFIVPGVLLVLPVLFMPSLTNALSSSLSAKSANGAVGFSLHPLVASTIVLFVVSYVLGLIIYYIGRILERTILERGEAPSRRVLTNATTSALISPVPDRIRSIAREHFHLSDNSGDSQLFSLIFRHLFMVGKTERIARFLHLRNLTRGATVVFIVWSVAAVGKIIFAGAEACLFGTAIASATLAVLTDRVRRAYNKDIAEEVYVTYYVHTCTRSDPGSCAVPLESTAPEATPDHD
jgi:hypothetical protein